MKNCTINGNLDMNKKIYIHCDGGFGNRFNALIVGLALSRNLGFEPIILWPSTNWCRSSFNSLFETNHKVIEEDLRFFSENVDDYEFVMHGNFLNFKTNVHHPSSFGSFENLVEFCKNTSKENVVYNNDSIPLYLGIDNLISSIKELPFKEEIIKKTEEFIESNNLNSDFYGVHLRNTDFYDPHKPNFDAIYSMISENSDKKYFVCSDDKDLENKFSQLDNVYVYEKTKYVEKLTEEGDWRSVIVDDVGIEYPFNVERSDESVIQAMVDLIILSKSNIIKTSDSSFLQTAALLKYSYDGQK